jgi:hypothetical protein
MTLPIIAVLAILSKSDRDITITSFSAGQTNTRAKKDFRMSSLLNIELDNFGDSIS